MEESTFRVWDIIIKGLGFIGTALSIYFGLTQFSEQQHDAWQLESAKQNWQKQTQVYADVCMSAGTLAAKLSDADGFKKEKENFLKLYYGQVILVQDSGVENAMRELRSYADIVEPNNPDAVIKFKAKVMDLTAACKKSLALSKQELKE